MAAESVDLWPAVLGVLQAQRGSPIHPAPFLGLPLGLRGGELVALPSGVEHVLELLGDELSPDMGLAENERTRRLTFEDGYKRAFHTALFAGMRSAKVGDADVTVLGIGLR